MNKGFEALIDSDAFIGLLVSADAHHERATQRFGLYARKLTPIAVTNFVIAETATWLSRFAGREQAAQFFGHVRTTGLPVIYVDKAIQQDGEALFLKQPIKNVSMVDCLNVVVAKRYSIPSIFSFDRFYTRFGFDLSNQAA